MTKLYIMIIFLFSISSQASVVVGVIDTDIDLPNQYSKYILDNTSINFTHRGIINTLIGSLNKTEKRYVSHGSHVSSTIIGDNSFYKNDQRFLEINNDVKILSMNYYDENASGLENLNNSLEALRYAINKKVNIINYSGGGPEFSIEEYNLFSEANDKGILIIVAAGNESNNIDLNKQYYPASYDFPNMISVGAFIYDKNGSPIIAKFSNFGKKTVSLLAPATFSGYYDKNTFKEMTGTSQATSVVTNLAVAIKSKYPQLTASQIKQAIISGVTSLPYLDKYCKSSGIINFENTFKILEESNKDVISHIQIN